MEKPKYKETVCCCKPFEEMEIHVTGKVYFCCPAFNNHYEIGNIFEQTPDEVWNGEKAVKFREKILKGDYSPCNENSCTVLRNRDFKTKYDTIPRAVMEVFPLKINLGYDYECNSACVICRDKINRLSDEELERLNSKIDTFFLPLLKNVKVLVINSGGDAFSRHSSLLIKKAAETYPDLKFELMTNGILCSPKVLNKLGIRPSRTELINISLHAAKKETYGRMVKDGEKKFDVIMRNIKYLGRIRKGRFSLRLNFVVTSLNYRDLPDFAKLCEEAGASYFSVWEYRPEQNASSDNKKEELDITQETHKDYKNLIKVLQHPLLKKHRRLLSPVLQDIQNQSGLF